MITKPEGVYRQTKTQARTILSINCKKLSEGVEQDDEHSVIAKSQSTSSSINKFFAFMASTLEEIAERFEEHSQVQKMKGAML